MVFQDSKVCCCNVYLLTLLIVCFQIFAASYGIFYYGDKIAHFGDLNIDVKGDTSANSEDLPEAQLIFGLVCYILCFLLALLLLLGNVTEKIGLLRVWLRVTLISVFYVIVVKYKSLSEDDVTGLKVCALYFVVATFMMRVVAQRIDDIKVSSGWRTTKV